MSVGGGVCRHMRFWRHANCCDGPIRTLVARAETFPPPPDPLPPATARPPAGPPTDAAACANVHYARTRTRAHTHTRIAFCCITRTFRRRRARAYCFPGRIHSYRLGANDARPIAYLYIVSIARGYIATKKKKIKKPTYIVYHYIITRILCTTHALRNVVKA